MASGDGSRTVRLGRLVKYSPGQERDERGQFTTSLSGDAIRSEGFKPSSAGEGVAMLDRDKPGGDEEYRRIQQEHQAETGSSQVGLDERLKAHGYDGVVFTSPSESTPQYIVHDPTRLSVASASKTLLGTVRKAVTPYDPDAVDPYWETDEGRAVWAAGTSVSKYSPDQPRDERGRFGSGGGDGVVPEPEHIAFMRRQTEAFTAAGGTVERLDPNSNEHLDKMEMDARWLDGIRPGNGASMRLKLGFSEMRSAYHDAMNENIDGLLVARDGAGHPVAAVSYDTLGNSHSGVTDVRVGDLGSLGRLAGAATALEIEVARIGARSAYGVHSAALDDAITYHEKIGRDVTYDGASSSWTTAQCMDIAASFPPMTAQKTVLGRLTKDKNSGAEQSHGEHGHFTSGSSSTVAEATARLDAALNPTDLTSSEEPIKVSYNVISHMEEETRAAGDALHRGISVYNDTALYKAAIAAQLADRMASSTDDMVAAVRPCLFVCSNYEADPIDGRIYPHGAADLETADYVKLGPDGRLSTATVEDPPEEQGRILMSNDYVPTGTPEGDYLVRQFAVGQMVHQWAETSNDSDPDAWALQDAAQRVFGLDDAAPWDHSGDHNPPSPTFDLDNPVTAGVLEDFVQAQHDNTLAMFNDHSINPDDTITLYRGEGRTNTTSVEGHSTLKDLAGQTVDATFRPMTSWTGSPDTARSSYFTDSREAIMVRDVPVKDIIGTYLSGVGCSGESEFVLKGGVAEVNITEAGDVIQPYNYVKNSGDLSGTSLNGENLMSTNFKGVDLTGVDLSNAYLSYSNLNGANLTGADLTGAAFSGSTDFSGAVMTDVVNPPALKTAIGTLVKDKTSGETQEHGTHGWFSSGSDGALRLPPIYQAESISPKTGKPLASIAAHSSMHDEGLKGMPSKTMQAVVDRLVTTAGVTPEQATANLVDMFNKSSTATREFGEQWYSQAHEFNGAMARHYGLDEHVVSGITAALSPGQFWDSNQMGTRSVCAAFSEPDKIITQELADKVNAKDDKVREGVTVQAGETFGKYLNDPETTRAASILIASDSRMGIGKSYGNLDKAVTLARENDPSMINDVLGGAKVRSFFNNMSDPTGPDVTVDIHMMRAMVNGDNPDGEHHIEGGHDRIRTVNDKVNTITSSPSYSGASVGAYPVMADVVRAATAQINEAHGTSYTPSQVQAIVWGQQLQDYTPDRMVAVNKGKE